MYYWQRHCLCKTIIIATVLNSLYHIKTNYLFKIKLAAKIVLIFIKTRQMVANYYDSYYYYFSDI